MERLRDHESLRVFYQYGYEHSKESGKHSIGRCPFCGSQGKHALTFYVNVETKKWDCKSCGKEGGYQVFLQEMLKFGQEHFRGNVAIALSKDRGIKISTLRKAGLGYNPLTKAYMIPNYEQDGERIWNIRLYRGRKVISTTGCKGGLAGWHEMTSATDVIWLCEGEWDWLAMREALGESPELAVAVPGAESFKAEWATLFKGKTVYSVFDNDHDRIVKGVPQKGAGVKGAIRVYNALVAAARELRFVHWPESYDDGYDLRDFYHKEKDKTQRALKSMLRPLPMGIEFETAKQEKKELSGKGLEVRKIYEAYQKWLHLPDTTVLDVLFGAVIGNRLQGKPIWLFLVAPPGGTKTELIVSLNDSPFVELLSSLTPQTLVSGMKFEGGMDPSLLPKLDGKIASMPDFTGILSMNRTFRDEIFGIFREAYDGEYSKAFGNGQWRRYKSKFGIIAAVTPIIELHADDNVVLGERFLRYNIPIARSAKGRKQFLQRALTNTTQEDKMHTELRETAKRALNHDYKDVPEIPRALEEKIINLAQWASTMRGSVSRDKYHKEVTHKPYIELGTRMTQQFCKLIRGVGMFRHLKSVSDDEYAVVRKVALSTVPSQNEEIVRKMYRGGKFQRFSLDMLSDMIGLPTITCQRKLEDLALLGVLKRIRISSLKTEWEMHDEFLEVMQAAELYK